MKLIDCIAIILFAMAILIVNLIHNEREGI